MAQNPLQTALPPVWIGPSALNRIIVSIPGALPQEEIQPQKEQGLKARSIASNV